MTFCYSGVPGTSHFLAFFTLNVDYLRTLCSTELKTISPLPKCFTFEFKWSLKMHCSAVLKDCKVIGINWFHKTYAV